MRQYLAGEDIGQPDVGVLTAAPTMNDIRNYLMHQDQFENQADGGVHEYNSITSNINAGNNLFTKIEGLINDGDVHYTDPTSPGSVIGLLAQSTQALQNSLNGDQQYGPSSSQFYFYQTDAFEDVLTSLGVVNPHLRVQSLSYSLTAAAV